MGSKTKSLEQDRPLKDDEELAILPTGRVYTKVSTNPDGTHISTPYEPPKNAHRLWMYYFHRRWWYTARHKPEPPNVAENPEDHYVPVPEDDAPDRPLYRAGWIVEFKWLKEKLQGRVRQVEFFTKTKATRYSVIGVEGYTCGFNLSEDQILRRVPK